MADETKAKLGTPENPLRFEPPIGEYNVVQFFPDETYEYVLRNVCPAEAVHRAKRLTESVGGRLGTTRRVIITDGGDFTCFEWRFGEGVVYPTREMLANARKT